MSRDINVGLIGYGLAGRVFHAPTITAVEGLHLKAVVERRGEESRCRYPWAHIARDAEELYTDDAIELVVVATPNALHYELARRGLEAGKHVVVDKPFTVTTAEADALIALAKHTGKHVSVYHNRRWDGDFLTLKRLLSEGAFGDLVEFESRIDRYRLEPKPGAWREADGPGAGILFDLGPHLLDQALTLFGMPHALTADIRRQRRSSGPDDSFHLLLDYGHLRVQLAAGMMVAEPTPRFRVHGSEAAYVKYGLDPQEDALRGGRVPTERDWGKEPASRWGILNSRRHGLTVRGRVETLPGRYTAYYENLRDAIRGTAQPAVTPGAGRDTVHLIELAFRSHAQRRTLDVAD